MTQRRFPFPILWQVYIFNYFIENDRSSKLFKEQVMTKYFDHDADTKRELS